MILNKILEGLNCAYNNQGDFTACEYCELLPPYYFENSSYRNCFSIFINRLKDYLRPQLNKELEDANFDKAFGEDDRIWENGVEIK